MQNLFKRQDQARKSIAKILLVLALGLAIIVCAILSAIFSIPDKVTEYAPNQTMVLSDTTNEWHDNFDSTYIFNGCVHYTNKQK